MPKNNKKLNITSKRTLLISGFILAIILLISSSAFAYQLYISNQPNHDEPVLYSDNGI